MITLGNLNWIKASLGLWLLLGLLGQTMVSAEPEPPPPTLTTLQPVDSPDPPPLRSSLMTWHPPALPHKKTKKRIHWFKRRAHQPLPSTLSALSSTKDRLPVSSTTPTFQSDKPLSVASSSDAYEMTAVANPLAGATIPTKTYVPPETSGPRRKRSVHNRTHTARNPVTEPLPGLSSPEATPNSSPSFQNRKPEDTSAWSASADQAPHSPPISKRSISRLYHRHYKAKQPVAADTSSQPKPVTAQQVLPSSPETGKSVSPPETQVKTKQAPSAGGHSIRWPWPGRHRARTAQAQSSKVKPATVSKSPDRPTSTSEKPMDTPYMAVTGTAAVDAAPLTDDKAVLPAASADSKSMASATLPKTPGSETPTTPVKTEGAAAAEPMADNPLSEAHARVGQLLQDEQPQMTKDMAVLWQAAVERSGTIRYAIEKLSRRDATGKKSDNSFNRRMLQSLVSLGGVAGTLLTQSPVGLMGNGVMQEALRADPSDPSRAPVSDADMVILAKSVETLQSQLLQAYLAYSRENRLWRQSQEARRSLQAQVAHIDPPQVADSLLDVARQQEAQHRQAFINARNGLGLLVGSEALLSMEQLNAQPASNTVTKTDQPLPPSSSQSDDKLPGNDKGAQVLKP